MCLRRRRVEEAVDPVLDALGVDGGARAQHRNTERHRAVEFAADRVLPPRLGAMNEAAERDEKRFQSARPSLEEAGPRAGTERKAKAPRVVDVEATRIPGELLHEVLVRRLADDTMALPDDTDRPRRRRVDPVILARDPLRRSRGQRHCRVERRGQDHMAVAESPRHGLGHEHEIERTRAIVRDRAQLVEAARRRGGQAKDDHPFRDRPVNPRGAIEIEADDHVGSAAWHRACSGVDSPVTARVKHFRSVSVDRPARVSFASRSDASRRSSHPSSSSPA